MRLTGAIPKQSNSTAQIWLLPWLNLRRKPELDLLSLELDFLYGLDLIVLRQALKLCKMGVKSGTLHFPFFFCLLLY